MHGILYFCCGACQGPLHAVSKVRYRGSGAHGRAGWERPLGLGVVDVFGTPSPNDRFLRSLLFATGRRTPAMWCRPVIRSEIAHGQQWVASGCSGHL